MHFFVREREREKESFYKIIWYFHNTRARVRYYVMWHIACCTKSRHSIWGEQINPTEWTRQTYGQFNAVYTLILVCSLFFAAIAAAAVAVAVAALSNGNFALMLRSRTATEKKVRIERYARSTTNFRRQCYFRWFDWWIWYFFHFSVIEPFFLWTEFLLPRKKNTQKLRIWSQIRVFSRSKCYSWWLNEGVSLCEKKT